jgi:hypothetical protein
MGLSIAGLRETKPPYFNRSQPLSSGGPYGGFQLRTSKPIQRPVGVAAKRFLVTGEDGVR